MCPLAGCALGAGWRLSLQRQSTLKGATRKVGAASGLRKKSRGDGRLQGDKGEVGVDRFDPGDFRSEKPKTVLGCESRTLPATIGSI